MPKVPKIRSLHISRKAWGMKLISCLQTNKSFLQVDSITLGLHSQACPKYPKQQVYNIFKISQGKSEGSWFFACRYMEKVSSNWYYYFRCLWPGMPQLPKVTSFLFLYNISRKKWVMKLIFCMHINIKVSYWLILAFLASKLPAR